MSILDNLINRFRRGNKAIATQPTQSQLPEETPVGSSEVGLRPTPERQQRYLYSSWQIDYGLQATIRDIRQMDALDGRVKRIHNRLARDVTRGGLMLAGNPSERVNNLWKGYVRRLQLDNPAKLKSDARGLAMEGSLCLQWVLDDLGAVIAGVRMPTETIRPNVGQNGRFLDVTKAYTQFDLVNGRDLCSFPLYQLTVSRLDPDNFDDLGSMGRPFLDASREVWNKLSMTENDLVIRRRHRAPLRMAHVLEGANKEELDTYQNSVEANNDQITLDYYLNKKGGVTPVQGDANLDQIKDVVLLLDTFFAGSPLPKGLAGYTDGLARDILEDLKRDYYDEVDQMQDVQAYAYDSGFRLHLLVMGINPDNEAFKVTFAERRTESLSQTTDRALKLKAIGLPQSMILEELGKDPEEVRKRLDIDRDRFDPYPGQPDSPSPSLPTVKITPGNGRKGESATSIPTPKA